MSNEIFAMISNVTLGEIGWKNKVYSGLIISAVKTGNAGFDQIKYYVNKVLNSHFNSKIFQSSFDGCITDRSIVRDHEGKYKLNELLRSKIESDEAEFRKIENSSKLIFEDIFIQNGAIFNWETFKEKYLQGVIKSFIEDKEVPASTIEKIAEAEEIDADLLIKCIRAFLSRKSDSNVKKFLLHFIHGQYNLSSIALDEETLNSWRPAKGKNYRIRLLLDTNFLFSVLDLHEHPANEVVSNIVAASNAVRNFIDIKYYILPRTIKELSNSIRTEGSDLARIRFSPAIAEGIVRSGTSRGFVQKFAKKYIESGFKLNVSDYLKPYLDNLGVILRGKKIEIFNTNEASILSSDEFRNDFSTMLRYNETYPIEKQRGLNSIEHDLLLWHAANSNRPTFVTLNIEAGIWLITLDKRLIDFDKKKSKNPAICLPPLQLLDWIQIWLPKSEISNDSLLMLLKLPVVDVDYEKDTQIASNRILSALSSMGDTSTFSPDTISELLLDRKLRNEVLDADSDSVVETLIENELAAKIETLKSDLENSKSDFDKANQKTSEITSELSEKINSLKSEISRIESEKETLQRNKIDAEESLNREARLKDAEIEQSNQRAAAINSDYEKIQDELKMQIAWEKYWDKYIKLKWRFPLTILLISIAAAGAYILFGRVAGKEFFKINVGNIFVIPGAIVSIITIIKMLKPDMIFASLKLILLESHVKETERIKFMEKLNSKS